MMLFGTCAEVLGTRAEVFGTRAEVFGTRTEVFGTRAEVFGTGAEVFGTRAEVFGTRAEVLGTRAEVFGTGAESPSLGTTDAKSRRSNRVPEAVDLVDLAAVPFRGSAFGGFLFGDLPEFQRFVHFGRGAVLITGLCLGRGDPFF